MSIIDRITNSTLRQRHEIAELLSHASHCHWFESVGEKQLREYNMVTSWNEAIAYLQSEDSDSAWVVIGDEERNRMSVRAYKHDSDKFRNEWNPNARLVREAVTSVLQSALKPVLEREEIDGVVFGFCKSAFLWHCIYVSHFDDPKFPSVAFDCVSLFLDGHCPCGYTGTYPDGNLIVY